MNYVKTIDMKNNTNEMWPMSIAIIFIFVTFRHIFIQVGLTLQLYINLS